MNLVEWDLPDNQKPELSQRARTSGLVSNGLWLVTAYDSILFDDVVVGTCLFCVGSRYFA